MALTSRLGFCLGLLSLVAACSGATGQGAKGAEGVFDPRVRRPGKDAVLVLLPDTEQTRAVLLGIQDELKADFDVVPRRFEPNEGADVIESALAEVQPKALVLMDNPTLKAYRALQLKDPKREFPPAVVVMASFLEEHHQLVRNATGIAYEVPALTLFSNLRTILASPVKRVGVVYRPAFRGYVERQRRLAERESIVTIGVEVPAEPSPRDVRAAVERLRAEENVDALWLLNDNGLLAPDIIQGVWMNDHLHGRRVPLVVGASALVDSRHQLGTFAMVPDHSALGVQAASLVFDLADNGWKLQSTDIQYPLSTKTVMDIKQAEQNFKLSASAMSHLDHIVQ